MFNVFARKPFGEFTRNQIKRESKEKSNNGLALAVDQLKKEGVVIEKKIGRSGLLMLELSNELTIAYISLANRLGIKGEVEAALLELKKEISSITPFYALVIFGSYAAGEQKKSSDLDIAVLIDGVEKRGKIEAAINSARLKVLLRIDAHVISGSEFIGMLTNDEENLGKQIARKHLVVHNQGIFYDIVGGGMKHGFHV